MIAEPSDVRTNKSGWIEYKWLVAIVFAIGMFMELMDTTVVNVALPTLARDFHANAAGIEWVVLGYLLSLAVWIPASGWIGDRFGTKKTFLFALFTFTAASALCGQAHSLSQLVAFRVLQGVGGGMLTPVGTAMLFRAFPPIERAKASTVLMLPTVVAPALGPVVGGWIVTKTSWRWIFYINLPIGVVGFIVGAIYLRESKEETVGRLDVPGFVLSALGLAGILYALSQGPERGWTSVAVLLTGLGGAGLIAVLVFVELRVSHPMLAMRLYKDRMFRNATIVTTFTYGSFAGVLFLLPQFLQNLRGLTPLQSGLATFPQAVGVVLMSQVVGRLYHIVGPRRLVIGGMSGLAFVTLGFQLIDIGTNLWWLRGLMFLRGICMSFAFMPLQASSYANIEAQDTGRASAIYSTQRQVAAALGVAILGTVWISRTKSNNAGVTNLHALQSGALNGFHVAFLAANVLVLLSVGAAMFIRDADAASTVKGRQPKGPSVASNADSATLSEA